MASITLGVLKLGIYVNTPIIMLKFYIGNTTAGAPKELFSSHDYIEPFMHFLPQNKTEHRAMKVPRLTS